MVHKILAILLMSLSIYAADIQKPTGIVNKGNTCYMNAILQCLYNIQPFTQFLLSKRNTDFYIREDFIVDYKTKTSIPTNSIAYEYIDLIHKMNVTQSSPVDPIKFCERMWPAMGSLYSQEDADEFMTKLVDHLIDVDINRKLVTSFYGFPFNTSPRGMPGRLFWITIGSVLTDQRTIKLPRPLRRRTASLANRISVEIAGDTLKNCLDNYFKEEALQDPAHMSKKLELLQLPPYFIITLKRFKTALTDERLAIDKIETPVTFPINNLNMQPYLAQDSPDKTFTTYNLVGLVQHSGSFIGGHYTAYIKYNNSWFFCDDSSTTKFDNMRLFETLGKEHKNSSSTPYILFYKKTGNGIVAPFPLIITEVDLKKYLESRNISDQKLHDFLKLRNTPITLQDLVNGINDRFISAEAIIGYIREHKPVQPKTTKFKSISSDLYNLQDRLTMLQTLKNQLNSMMFVQ